MRTRRSRSLPTPPAPTEAKSASTRSPTSLWCRAAPSRSRSTSRASPATEPAAIARSAHPACRAGYRWPCTPARHRRTVGTHRPYGGRKSAEPRRLHHLESGLRGRARRVVHPDRVRTRRQHAVEELVLLIDRIVKAADVVGDRVHRRRAHAHQGDGHRLAHGPPLPPNYEHGVAITGGLADADGRDARCRVRERLEGRCPRRVLAAT